MATKRTAGTTQWQTGRRGATAATAVWVYDAGLGGYVLQSSGTNAAGFARDSNGDFEFTVGASSGTKRIGEVYRITG